MMQKKIWFKVLFIAGYVVAWLMAIWCTGAIWFQRWITSEPWKIVLMTLYVLVTIGLLSFCWRKKYLLAVSLGLTFLITASWLIFLQPTGKRNWKASCSRIPHAVFSPDGRYVTISNIRDFKYRTENDFDVCYRTETYPVYELETLDYAIVHWDGLELIGHMILSFGFKDGRHLAFSAETRLGEDESQNELASIYRQYEMIYIISTEEDVFKLRTNYRHEDVFLYPVNNFYEYTVMTFCDLVRRSSDLEQHPQFYNALTTNCTSFLFPSIRRINPDFESGLMHIFNGITDKAMYENGLFKRTDPQESFESYKKRHYANQYVQDIKDGEDYSRMIRPERNGKSQNEGVKE